MFNPIAAAPAHAPKPTEQPRLEPEHSIPFDMHEKKLEITEKVEKKPVHEIAADQHPVEPNKLPTQTAPIVQPPVSETTPVKTVPEKVAPAENEDIDEI